MRTEEEIRKELEQIRIYQENEKTNMGKSIYGVGINIIRWVLGEIDQL